MAVPSTGNSVLRTATAASPAGAMTTNLYRCFCVRNQPQLVA